MNNFVLLFVIALCSTCTSSSLNRITGGSPATAHNQFPYMISLQQKSQVNTPTRGHRCGGALVSLRHAVTAAFCVYDVENPSAGLWVHSVLNPNDYRVFAGAIDLTNDTSADHHRDIQRFTVHPDYKPSNRYVNDIAVITLTSAFSSNNVQIAPLATNDVQESLSYCTSSGWGAQNNLNVASTQLMHVQKFAIADNNLCQPFYISPWAPQIPLQNTMICGSSTESYSSCQGDLGNPLVCSGNLQGILVSTAYSSCSVANLPPRPELYTRISSFRSWIRTTAGASTFQPAMVVLVVITIVQIITSNVLN